MVAAPIGPCCWCVRQKYRMTGPFSLLPLPSVHVATSVSNPLSVLYFSPVFLTAENRQHLFPFPSSCCSSWWLHCVLPHRPTAQASPPIAASGPSYNVRCESTIFLSSRQSANSIDLLLAHHGQRHLLYQGRPVLYRGRPGWKPSARAKRDCRRRKEWEVRLVP